MSDDAGRHVTVDLHEIRASAYRLRLVSWRERLAGLLGREIELPPSRLGAVLRIGAGQGGPEPDPAAGGFSGTWIVPDGVSSATIQVFGGGAAGQCADGKLAGSEDADSGQADGEQDLSQVARQLRAGLEDIRDRYGEQDPGPGDRPAQ